MFILFNFKYHMVCNEQQKIIEKFIGKHELNQNVSAFKFNYCDHFRCSRSTLCQTSIRNCKAFVMEREVVQLVRWSFSLNKIRKNLLLASEWIDMNIRINRRFLTIFRGNYTMSNEKINYNWAACSFKFWRE